MECERDTANFVRRLEAARESHPQPAPTTKPIGQEMVEAINRLAKAKHPIEQKRELANLIMARVHCPGFHRAEAEKAAAYVLEPATGQPALPMAVLSSLLDELDQADAKGQVSPYINGKGGGRGKWFNGVLNTKRLPAFGISQRKKGVRRT